MILKKCQDLTYSQYYMMILHVFFIRSLRKIKHYKPSFLWSSSNGKEHTCLSRDSSIPPTYFCYLPFSFSFWNKEEPWLAVCNQKKKREGKPWTVKHILLISQFLFLLSFKILPRKVVPSHLC